MNKKAAIELPVRTKVTVIIAIVFLLLFLMLMRSCFGVASIKVKEKLSEFTIPPIAVISSPYDEEIFDVFSSIPFDGSASYDLNYDIVGYYWDFDSDLIIDSRSPKVDFYYFEPGEYNITLKVINSEGAIGSTSIIVKVYTRNQKNEGLEKSMFMIRDNDRSNNQDILRLVPITTWNDRRGLHVLPYYVYYVRDQSSSLTEEQLKELLQKYGKEHAYVFGDPYLPCPEVACAPPTDKMTCCEFSWGTVTKVNNLDDVYFDFWDFYEYVVLVPSNETESALIAALFASFYNSPIIFVGKDNLEQYKEKIINDGVTRQVYYIPSRDAMDSEVHNFITQTNNIAWIAYSSETLRDPNRRVNRIVKLISNVSMQP